MHHIHPSAAPDSDQWSAAQTIAYFGGDEQLVLELIALFLGSYARHLDRLRSRMREGDLTGLGRAAHAIKGSLANFTREGPTTTARELEQLCGLGLHDAAAAKLERLERELAAMAAAMEAFRNEATRCES